MIIEYEEYLIYKDILIEKFFSIKTNNNINALTDLERELEYFIYYLKLELEKNETLNKKLNISELEDLLSIIKFLIKIRYISIPNIKEEDSSREIVHSLRERLIKIKNENKIWSLREISYISIMLFACRNINELIELCDYNKQQIRNYYEKNEINKKEYNRLIVIIQSHLTTILFEYKFNISMDNEARYKEKEKVYDEIFNNNLDEMLKNNTPNRDNAAHLILANCKKTILTKDIKYMKNALLLIKYYKEYYRITFIKNHIIKYEKDKNLYRSYINLIDTN